MRGLGCARLALELTLEPAGRDARAWELPAPTRDTRTLLTLARLDLEARPPGAASAEGAVAIAAFVFTATPDRTRPEQGTLFGPPALSPERLATTLARLFALLGPDRVGSPRPVDGHRPERLALVPFAPPAAALLLPQHRAAGHGRTRLRQGPPGGAHPAAADRARSAGRAAPRRPRARTDTHPESGEREPTTSAPPSPARCASPPAPGGSRRAGGAMRR